jgi:hypothetical protein
MSPIEFLFGGFSDRRKYLIPWKSMGLMGHLGQELLHTRPTYETRLQMNRRKVIAAASLSVVFATGVLSVLNSR